MEGKNRTRCPNVGPTSLRMFTHPADTGTPAGDTEDTMEAPQKRQNHTGSADGKSTIGV